MLDRINRAEILEIPESKEDFYFMNPDFVFAAEYALYKGDIAFLKGEIGYSPKENKRVVIKDWKPVKAKKGRRKLSNYEKEIKCLLKEYERIGHKINCVESWKLGFADGCLWRGQTDEHGNK